MVKELYIMRHAKSAWDTNEPDIARPLKKRGINASKRMGDGLIRLGWVPEKVLLSPAKRVQQTYEHLGLDISITEDSRIYEASLSDLFDVIAEVPNDINKLMLIGHNPSLEALLLHLTPSAEPQKNGKLLTTANVARIGLEGGWIGLDARQGQLLGLIRPKEM